MIVHSFPSRRRGRPERGRLSASITWPASERPSQTAIALAPCCSLLSLKSPASYRLPGGLCCWLLKMISLIYFAILPQVVSSWELAYRFTEKKGKRCPRLQPSCFWLNLPKDLCTLLMLLAKKR